MQEFLRAAIQGFVKIKDSDTGEILVDTHNDVLYGNMSTALAHSLLGNSNSFLFYMGFGNGGAFINPTGTISYKPSLGGATSLIKDPTANLYNTVYVKKLSNDSTASPDYNSLSRAYIPTGNTSSNYEDIVIEVTLGYDDLPVGDTYSETLQQLQVDNSTFVGSSNSVYTPDSLVFNEIGLFAGSNNLFTGGATTTVSELLDFVNQGANFSNSAGSASKLMLTHVVFHPVQKSQNRSLEIIYTLRIQMGAN